MTFPPEVTHTLYACVDVFPVDSVLKQWKTLCALQESPLPREWNLNLS